MPQTSFTITNGEGSAASSNTDTTTLNGAIRSIDVGGSNAATNTNYTITLTASITLSAADLLAINLPAMSSLTIVGGNFTLDGNNHAQRGLFVYSGTVTVQNLTIANAAAAGGNAAPSSQGGGGGGGAGLGGGLFVASAGNVILNNVTFSNDKASGGSGSNGKSGGGGGLGGAGGSTGNNEDGSGGGGIGVGASGGVGGGSRRPIP